ncbi:unnamed protein product [Trichobilharzia regenti]|nr:unnamed protein product [Trichobilharzia regenti]
MKQPVLYLCLVDLEVELSCVDEAGKACGMGILGRYEPGTVGNAGGRPGGVLLHCTQDLIRRLGDQKVFPLLQLLSKVRISLFFAFFILLLIVSFHIWEAFDSS